MASKQVRLILLDELIELRLALCEMIVGELLHQADHVVERPLGFAAGLTQRPQPGDVDVGMAGGVDDYIHRGTSCFDARSQYDQSRLDAIIESITIQRVTRVQGGKCIVERVQQSVPGGIILIQILCRLECHARQDDQIPRGLVDLHERTLSHVEPGEHVATGRAAQPGPAVESKSM